MTCGSRDDRVGAWASAPFVSAASGTEGRAKASVVRRLRYASANGDAGRVTVMTSLR